MFEIFTHRLDDRPIKIKPFQIAPKDMDVLHCCIWKCIMQ